MAGWLNLVLVTIALTAAVAESRMIPAEPISVMLDTYGDPVMFLREKRTVVHPYPQRAMMFTGYYRPVRRSSNGGQATGVFAQGNAVSGEAFFGGVNTPRLNGGPEPIDEPQVSSAEAQAAPESDEAYNEQAHHVYHQEHHRQQQGQHHDDRNREEEQQHRQQEPLIPQEHQEPEHIPLTTEIMQPAEEPISPSTEVPITRPKVHGTKKVQKTPVIADADGDDDDDDDEVDDEDDEPIVPFVPFKGNRRRQGYPNLNNFFPMVFSFPRMATRAGSAGSPPGTIMAIANSYSTGKGGVASSVATAYGGSPNGKKRRSQPAEE